MSTTTLEEPKQSATAVTAGPKRARVVTPLDLSDLPAKRDWRRVKAFCESFLVVPAGKNSRKPVKFLPWEVDVLRGLFPAKGSRPLQGLVVCGRGNGKSFLASCILAYLAFADEQESPQLLCVAKDIRQAGIVYGAVRRMIETSPELAARTKLHVDKIAIPFNNGLIMPMPSNEEALLGWASTICLDELATVDHGVYESCLHSASKIPDSQVIAFSTPPSTTTSVMWELVEKARNAPSKDFFYKEFSGDPSHPIDCEHCEKAANPSLGHLLTRQQLAASRETSRPDQYRRLRLAQFVEKSDDAWLSRSEIDAVTTDEPIPWRSRIVLGFDGSYSGDTTVLVGATVELEPKVQLLAAWVPDDHGDDYRVDPEQVESKIRELCRQFDVVEISADPARWARSLQVLAKDGLPCVEHPQSDSRMGPSTVQMYEAIRSERISLVHNEIFRSHLLHCHVTETQRGAKVHKSTPKSTDRIDSGPAAIMAFSRAVWWANRPPKKRTRMILTARR